MKLGLALLKGSNLPRSRVHRGASLRPWSGSLAGERWRLCQRPAELRSGALASQLLGEPERGATRSVLIRGRAGETAPNHHKSCQCPLPRPVLCRGAGSDACSRLLSHVGSKGRRVGSRQLARSRTLESPVQSTFSSRPQTRLPH